MGRRHGHGSLQKKRTLGRTKFPEVFIDSDADFASIKLAPGVESKSYIKDGFVFCENSRGKIIEIQVLNLSALKQTKRKSVA